MKRLLASLIIALAASTAWGANYTLSVDTQTANEEQIIDRVFSGNTLMLTFNFLENGTAATLTEWTNMVFHYSKNRFVSSGTYQVTGTKSGSSATFISTNVMAGADKEWYWSVVADSSNGYKRTWGTGTLIQRYDPAAGNPSPISPSITIDFDNYTESGLISGVTISNSTIIGSGASITNIDHGTAHATASLDDDDHPGYLDNTGGTVTGAVTVTQGFTADIVTANSSLVVKGPSDFQDDVSDSLGVYTISDSAQITGATTLDGPVTATNVTLYGTATGPATITGVGDALYAGVYSDTGTNKNSENVYQEAGGGYLFVTTGGGGTFWVADTVTNHNNVHLADYFNTTLDGTYAVEDGSSTLAVTVTAGAGNALTVENEALFKEPVEFEDQTTLQRATFKTATGGWQEMTISDTASNIAFSLLVDTNDRWTVPIAGNYLGMQMYRSVAIGANQDALDPNEAIDIRNITGANTNYIDFSTSGSGADLWVEDNVQIGGALHVSGVGDANTVPSRIWIVSTNGATMYYSNLSNAFAAVASGEAIVISGDHAVKPGLNTAAANAYAATPLQLTSVTNVTVYGVNNAQILPSVASSNGSFISIFDCQNITIRDLTIDSDKPDMGTNGSGDFYPMILFAGTNDTARFESLRLLDGGGHGIAHQWGNKLSSNVWVQNCYFRDFGDTNAASTNASGWGPDGAAISPLGPNATITGNLIEQGVRGIEVQDSTSGVPSQNIIISHNTIRDLDGLAIMVLCGTGVSADFTDILISDNTINNVGGGSAVNNSSGLVVQGGQRITVADNIIRGSGKGGIVLDCSKADLVDCIVSGNIVSDTGWRGIQVSDSDATDYLDGVLIEGNYVELADHDGIRVSGSNIVVRGNILRNNGADGTYAGIMAEASTGGSTANLIIEGNACIDTLSSQDYGIWISEATITNATVTMNTYSGNVNAGLQDDGTSSYTLDFDAGVLALSGNLNTGANTISNAVFLGDGAGITNSTFGALQMWNDQGADKWVFNDTAVTSYHEAVTQNMTGDAGAGTLINTSAGYYRVTGGGRVNDAADGGYLRYYTNSVKVSVAGSVQHNPIARQYVTANRAYPPFDVIVNLPAGTTNMLWWNNGVDASNVVIDAYLIMEKLP